MISYIYYMYVELYIIWIHTVTYWNIVQRDVSWIYISWGSYGLRP